MSSDTLRHDDMGQATLTRHTTTPTQTQAGHTPLHTGPRRSSCCKGSRGERGAVELEVQDFEVWTRDLSCAAILSFSLALFVTRISHVDEGSGSRRGRGVGRCTCPQGRDAEGRLQGRGRARRQHHRRCVCACVRLVAAPRCALRALWCPPLLGPACEAVALAALHMSTSDTEAATRLWEPHGADARRAAAGLRLGLRLCVSVCVCGAAAASGGCGRLWRVWMMY